jgi:WhiB family transcriptional regulator, redox-sensing transcriptional regulator
MNEVPSYNWEQDANCRGLDPADFFPSDEAHSKRAREAELLIAKMVCRDCVVWLECLDKAIKTGEQHGVWGGFDADERKELAAQRAERKSRAIEVQAA